MELALFVDYVVFADRRRGL